MAVEIDPTKIESIKMRIEGVAISVPEDDDKVLDVHYLRAVGVKPCVTCLRPAKDRCDSCKNYFCASCTVLSDSGIMCSDCFRKQAEDTEDKSNCQEATAAEQASSKK